MKNYLNRRSFLHQTLLATAGIMVKSQAENRNTAPAEFEPPQPCPPTSWHKHGVILEASESWEGRRIQNFTSPTEPLDENRWRIWYSGRGS
ncbi:MAG: hypothetical protein JSV03_10260, partial [Planctomycetota bacterium]